MSLKDMGKIQPLRGFTLVEILLVVLILGILAGAALPRLSHTYRQLQWQKAAEDLRDLMRYAQGRAAASGCPLRLEFAGDYSSYWLTQSSCGGQNEVQETFARFPGRLGGTFSVPKGISVTPEAAQVVFYPDGQIDKTEVSVCAGGRCRIVSTKEQRGYVWILEPTP